MESQESVENINVSACDTILSPREAHRRVPMTKNLAEFIGQSRKSIVDILNGDDRRLILIVGPCSIHDPAMAMDYADRLVKLANEVQETILVVMRVYFEKPRSTIGWKGLINDPNLDGTFEVEEGLYTARALLRQITKMGLPIATEALDPIVPQYIQDFVSWTAIGARTTESQTHREMASGLSSPVGFKNGTDGNLEVAINAIKSASSPHSFLGMDEFGRVSVVQTKGNGNSHIVLRGGRSPNYDSASIRDCELQLSRNGLCPKIMIDCSHGNSRKDHKNQPSVAADIVKQVVSGNRSIKGLMIESSLYSGNQPFSCNRADLLYGVSITDKCIDFSTTENLIIGMHETLQRERVVNYSTAATLV